MSGWTSWCLLWGSLFLISVSIGTGEQHPTILEQFHFIFESFFPYHKDRSVTVKKGNAIYFRCQWWEGNPQRRILLLGPDNSTLKEVDVRDRRRSSMRYTIKIISCSDGGQYRCQVEGTEEVKSLTVLVRCPLTFKEPAVSPTEHVVSGEDATFSFRATSYTHNVRSCQLKKPDDTTIGCNSSSSVVTVTGQLPDVDVIVTLKDFTERDEGTWQLTVSNPTPSQKPATARFRVFIANYPDRSYFWYFWYSIGGGAALLAIIIMISVIIIVRKCKNRRKLPRTTAEAGGAVRRAVPLASSDDDYLEPVARRVESAGTAGDDHRAVPVASSDDCQEPVARRVESSAHEYVEVIPDSPTRLRPPHRVLPPVPLEGPYESLILDEVGQRSVYSRLGN